MIRKVGNQYILYTKDGSRVLGKHATRAEALAQESAIEISKHKKKKQ